MYTAYFCSAEIDQLKKLHAAKPIENKLQEIAWPSKITNLQHAVVIGKATQVVSLKSILRNYSLLHIMKAASRNQQLRCYKANWATLEIMKTLLKNRRSYKHHIGSPGQHDEDNLMEDG